MRFPRYRELKGWLAESARQMFEAPVYTLGIRVYRLGVAAAGMRSRKARLMIRGRRDVWSTLAAKVNPNDRNIWVHAASLGEFEQGRPLMEELRRRHPDRRIVLTFFSPSGYEVRKDWPGADCVLYLPFDTPRNARRLIDAINPEMVFFVKYEIWRNLLRALYRRSVPVYLISAAFTPSQKFFRRGCRWYSLWLRWFTRIFVQDERSRRLLESIGITDAVVAGDTRFDRVTDIMRSTRDIPQLAALRGDGSCPVLMAGSSWSEDEERYFPWLIKNRGKVRAVIAPHEFDSARLAAMRRALQPLDVRLLSEIPPEEASKAAGADVLIIDCFGLLSSAYRYADVAYIGGGFGAGIHNINEAAVYGIPVVYGPNNSRFIEARGLADAGGGFPVADAGEVVRTLSALLTGPSADTLRLEAGKAAAAYIRSNLGATARILDTLRL